MSHLPTNRQFSLFAQVFACAIVAFAFTANAHAQVGACCFPNGTCASESSLSCDLDGGAYQGDDVLCGDAGCAPTIVINEVDYDQPSNGMDNLEFIELKNTGNGPLNLSGFSVVLVDGNEGNANIYKTIDLPDTDLAAGDYFVICGNAGNVNNCDLDVDPDVNLIQDGNAFPDAVAIIYDGMVVDALSYEGSGEGVPGFTEGGNIVSLSDPAIFEVGLSRYPDGNDTDMNAMDFSRRCATPGQMNIEQNTDCAIDRGACCVADVCTDNVKVGDCAMQGGLFAGDGVGCDMVDCADAGACCRSNNTCEVALAVACAGDDTYLGMGTDCTGLDCSMGACCLPNGTCESATEASCSDDGGAFQGPTSLCMDVACPAPMGACCYPDGSCGVDSFDGCTGASGTFQGIDSICADVSCPQPTGACCLANGSCESETESSCTDDGGTYQGDDTLCENANCPQPTGACCYPDGTCATATAADCATASGTYQGDDSLCMDVACPQPTGACCLPNGSCESITETSCNDEMGLYQGDGYLCENVMCPQPVAACCLGDGGCIDATEGECAAASGTLQDPGSECATWTCPQPPTGACCAADGSCYEVTEAECDGIYQGDNTICADVNCPQPTGACEYDDDTCAITTEADCAGNYLGDDTNCPAPADPTGACCAANGSCSESTQVDCNGTYQGDNTTCADANCPQPADPTGACIDGNNNCTITTEADCNGSYQGDDSACPAPADPTGACVADDGSCSVTTEADCNGAYQGDDSACPPAADPTGACLAADGSCSITTQAACAGTYQGDNSSCDDIPPAEQGVPGCFPVFFLFQSLFGIPLCGPCVIVSTFATFAGMICMKRRLRRRYGRRA